MLPLSHDEVVHGKGSLLRKMPGDRWQQLANLRAYFAFMWAHPGKQLLFMGCEFGQDAEWAEARELDWWLLRLAVAQRDAAAGPATSTRSTGSTPALCAKDDDPDGFRWIDANDANGNVLSFVRSDGAGLARSPAWSTSRRSRTTTTASGCPRPAPGARCSTPTPRSTPAPGWATSARSRRRGARRTACPPRRRSRCRRWARCGCGTTADRAEPDRHWDRRLGSDVDADEELGERASG